MSTHFHKTILDNGVRVLTEKHPQSKAVSIGVWVNVGTRHEQKNIQGMAHFLEHLVFKGTKNRTAFQIARSLEALGGDLNAYTTKEYTCFHALVLKDHWQKALEVVSDLVANMQLRSKDFRNEKGVILQEIAMGEDNFEESVYDAFFSKVFNNHPLSTPILGTVKSIANLKMGQVRDFYTKQYTGRKLTISVAGNVDHHSVVKFTRQYLGRKPKGKNMDLGKPPVWIGSERGFIQKDSEQSHILLGFPAASYLSEMRFEALVLNTILGGGMSSRLYQRVREKKGLVYSIYSMLTNFIDFGLINIYAAADQKNIESIIHLVRLELKRLKEKGISNAEIESAKTQLVGSILLSSDDMENRMSSIAINDMIFSSYRPMEQVVDEIKQIDFKKMKNYFKNEFDLDQVAGVILGPDLGAFQNKWKNYSFK